MSIDTTSPSSAEMTVATLASAPGRSGSSTRSRYLLIRAPCPAPVSGSLRPWELAVNHGDARGTAGTVLGQGRSPTRPIRSHSRRGASTPRTSSLSVLPASLPVLTAPIRTAPIRTAPVGRSTRPSASGSTGSATGSTRGSPRRSTTPPSTSPLARIVVDRSVVGVMGGHAVARGSDRYLGVRGPHVEPGGLHVATGGGPGVMEAANLGAWMAPRPTPISMTRSSCSTRRPLRARRGRVRRRGGRGARAVAGRWRQSRRPDLGVRRRAHQRVRDAHREVLHEQHPRGRPARDRPRPGSSTRPAAPAPSRRSSPTPRRTASRSTRCAARWCSSVATFFEHEHPSSSLAARRQATAFGWADSSRCATTRRRASAFIARARSRRRGGTSGPSHAAARSPA